MIYHSFQPAPDKPWKREIEVPKGERIPNVNPSGVTCFKPICTPLHLSMLSCDNNNQYKVVYHVFKGNNDNYQRRFL